MKKKQTERVKKKGGVYKNIRGHSSYFTQKNGTSVSDVLVSVLFFDKMK